ncbi:hypothetical protein D9615_006395 [Tricholomella constricta]|uniref:BTB domain-containing protein n=1 Tax=Tricholomella constricta TaxID=117010 RepID=A0A8H5H595_9AGAR|nr:hypothetical protein D9615_006395 [Tricholomella constricta]
MLKQRLPKRVSCSGFCHRYLDEVHQAYWRQQRRRKARMAVRSELSLLWEKKGRRRTGKCWTERRDADVVVCRPWRWKERTVVQVLARSVITDNVISASFLRYTLRQHTRRIMPASAEGGSLPNDIRQCLPHGRRGTRQHISMNVHKLGPSAVDIQNHLYTSFLEGSTADVALRVHGSWDAIYKLHRVVLIQSGFFRSLFTAGFAESSPRLGSSNGPDEIIVHFDDPNITRSAFEVCISRLYGGGPPLDIVPSLIPSLSQPLTSSFPYEPPPHKVPADHHPATPRFLLSLLATALYLSIPSLASQALTSILSTVGPHTVLKYLNFALGRHIGPLDHEGGEPEAAVGLESIAHIIEYERSVMDTASIGNKSSVLGDHHIRNEDPSEPQGSISPISYNASDDHDTEGVTKQPSYHYGAVSDKIGEACACWLVRWGIDMLVYEEKLEDIAVPKERSVHISSRKRSKTVPSGAYSASDGIPMEKPQELLIPLIWSRGGLNAQWVTAIVSADSFFIQGERERYDFARRVVELRRKDGVLPAEEEEWAKLFNHGIYYANMAIEHIISISQDISPATKRPFVHLTTLQTALWTHSMLRHQITVRPMSSVNATTVPGSAPSPPPRDKELGITQTTADLLAGVSSNGTPDPEVYFPIPGNSSVRIGDNGSNFSGTPEGGTLSMDQLFTSTSSLSPPPSSPTLKPITVAATTGPLTTEADFFGLRPSTFTASSAIASGTKGKTQWSPYPPYRFAVEFWDLESLKEKSRLYSHTVWYAGSLFNVYVQVVRKKGQVQLGIYLHRQSSIEPIPPSSAPASFVTVRTETIASPIAGPAPSTPSQRLPRGISLPPLFPPLTQTTSHYSPSIHPASRSSTPLSSSMSTSPSFSTSSSPSSFSTSTSSSVTLPATAPPATPPQPFRDPRQSISAYFMINCASATGSSQTRFTSSPDVFSVSQSWGWKSSSLRTEEYMDVRTESAAASRDTPTKKEVSLRATIVLGLV